MTVCQSSMVIGFPPEADGEEHSPFTGMYVTCLAWDGKQAWRAELPAHHDLDINARGETLVLGRQLVPVRIYVGLIEPPGLECPRGEFAGLRQAAPGVTAQRIEHRGNHRPSAMAMKLGRRFAGITRPNGEPQHDRLIDQPADIVSQIAQHGTPRRRQRLTGQT